MRYRVDPPAPGLVNMRRDAAMLAAGRPAVRVYSWDPACVSLGRSQSEEETVDPRAVRRSGADVVRRPTGGGALLHDKNEATYAIVVPRAWIAPDVHTAYRRLAEGVVRTLRTAGVDASFVEGSGGRENLCYLRDEGVSVVVGGKKISGGAQLRNRGAVLQHGTLLVTRDAQNMDALLGGGRRAIEDRTTCLRDLGIPWDVDEAKRRLLEGFRATWSTGDAATIGSEAVAT